MAEIEFDFLQNIGRKIYEVLSSDDTLVDWLAEVVNYYNQNFEYPEDTIEKIIKYFSDDKVENHSQILDDIKRVVFDPDNTDNFLGCIFFPSVGEEEEEEGDDVDDNKLIIEEDEPKVIEESTLGPDEYFEYNINKMATLLQISHDIAYLLLNKFNWNKNNAEKNWLSDQKNILKSLRIDQKLVPSFQSTLSIKPAGKGECSFCLENKDLLQLYCGHKICEECLIDDIKQQILENKPPSCRQTCENGDLCNAEIMSQDIKKYLDEEFLKKYKITHRNYLTLINNEVRRCPNPFCDWIITPANRLPCHVGRCYRCNAITCLIGDHESHAPLMKCELMDHFTVMVAEEMNQLESDQKNWFAREERLKDYRRSHVSEVQSVLNQSIQDLKKKQDEEVRKEKTKVAECDYEINKYQTQLSDLRRKLNQYLDQCKPKSEISILTSQIDDLTDLYNKKAELKKLFLEDIKMNEKERAKNLATAQQESSFFINALNGQYQFYMSKFKESQEVRAYKGISVTSNDDDYIKRITKKCPKCHSLIQRDEGCNYMACNRCKFEFCWLCGEAWHPTHNDHFQCPKLKNIANTSNSKKSSCGINFNDLNDKKFYPQPMSIEKRAIFIRYNNLNNKFRENKERYNELYKELILNYENKVDTEKKSDQIPDYKLCPRVRLERALSKDYNEEDSKINALRFVNTILFAQSVVMWSFPSLYYMVSKPHEAQVFEYKVSELSKNIDKMLQIVSNASEYRGTELMRSLDTFKYAIEVIIDDAVIF